MALVERCPRLHFDGGIPGAHSLVFFVEKMAAPDDNDSNNDDDNIMVTLIIKIV